MPAADLAAADGAAVAVSWLDAHPSVAAVLGGPGRVSARNEPPYPRLVVTDPPGSDRDLRWLLAADIQLEALGDLDGSPGKAELRRILYVALGALTELPERDTPAGEPVVTAVNSTAAGGWAPLPQGQPRYVSVVRLSLHPPS